MSRSWEATMARAKPKLKDLTLAYLESHPADAASVLEHVPRESVTTVFAAMPARVGAPVLSHMIPVLAASAIATLPAETVAGLLRMVPTQPAAAILRYFSTEARQAVLAQMPTGAATACRFVLGYPEDSIGAITELDVLALPPDTTVREALARLRHSGNGIMDYVYVVNSDKRLYGGVALSSLLQAGTNTTLANVADRGIATLSAQATLTAAHDQPAWTTYHVLPVVDRQGTFIGAVRHTVLARALAKTRPPTLEEQYDGTPGQVAASLWQVTEGLLQTAVAWLPVGPRGGGR